MKGRRRDAASAPLGLDELGQRSLGKLVTYFDRHHCLLFDVGWWLLGNSGSISASSAVVIGAILRPPAMGRSERVSASWDAEYRDGRYSGEPPIAFVETILQMLRGEPAPWRGHGLYVGCGNGRNYLPLVDGGADLAGIDLSPEAIDQLVRRRPALAARLTCGDFYALPADGRFAYRRRDGRRDGRYVVVHRHPSQDSCRESIDARRTPGRPGVRRRADVRRSVAAHVG